MILKISRWAVATTTAVGIFVAAPCSSAAEGGDTPWLIPPYVLEFTAPLTRLFATNISFGARVSIVQETDLK
ncbi:MAG: hypothetical protein HYR88_05085, partial [Verrucomicrobia bacterium]|nr:hypothetical protein [Verrucomicrobiota bacterium]